MDLANCIAKPTSLRSDALAAAEAYNGRHNSEEFGHPLPHVLLHGIEIACCEPLFENSALRNAESGAVRPADTTTHFPGVLPDGELRLVVLLHATVK
jgi:hypothetical protein